MDMAKSDEMRKKSEANKVRLPTSTIDPKLLERLNDYCASEGRYRSNVVEKAIEELLDREEKKRSK